MSEMVERVARAICCPDGCAGDTGSGRPCDISSEDASAMRQARAAIEAMRKPTDVSETFREADIIINGTPLSAGQAMSLRVAVTNFFERMADPDALGNDEHGLKMTELYRLRLGEVLRLILPNKDTSHGK